MRILYDPPNIGIVRRALERRTDYLAQDQGPATQRVDPTPRVNNERVRRKQEKRRAPPSIESISCLDTFG